MFKDFLEKKSLIYLNLNGAQIEIREANIEDAQAFWDKQNNPDKVSISANTEENRIRSTKELYTTDVLTVGAKAANYAEAARILPDGVMREALTVPFYYYKEFINTNYVFGQITIADYLNKLLADPKVKTDRNFLIKQLEVLQEKMRDSSMTVNPKLVSELENKLNALYPGQPMRFRSSTNSEDLANFSGAGLYDSYTYEPENKKKTIQKVLQKTWASVLNVRAYDERERFGIVHSDVYMAILVSPSYPTELANGVAVTKNIADPHLGEGLYINTQLGEEPVTNPNPDLEPEQLVVTTGKELKLNYISYSTLSPNTPIMLESEVKELSKYLLTIHNHFKKVMDPENKNPRFAMDIEFKVDDIEGSRKIYLKQARPFID